MLKMSPCSGSSPKTSIHFGCTSADIFTSAVAKSPVPRNQTAALRAPYVVGAIASRGSPKYVRIAQE